MFNNDSTKFPAIKKVLDIKWSERLVLLGLVGFTLGALFRYLFWWFTPTHLPQNWSLTIFHSADYLLFALLSFVVFFGWFQRFALWFSLWFKSKPQHMAPRSGFRVAFLTCFVSDKEPLTMLENTLKAMRDVRYPHDTWVLDEGDDLEVKKICKRLGVYHFSRKGIGKYNQVEGIYRAKTKAGNHNAWRDLYEDRYDVVAQVDVDQVPDPSYLEKTLGYFQDPRVAFVGMPEVYKNTENWIARGAAEQSYFFHGPMQQGYYGCDMPFLIGSSHIYRVKAMRDIGGYSPTIVEDHLTGMHFYSRGWKAVFIPEVLAQGEGPQNWLDYFNQQMRWSFGLFEIFFKHTPRLIGKLRWKQKVHYFLAQLYYFSGMAVVIGIALTFVYLVYGINSANMQLLEWAYYAFPPFIFAQIIDIYAHRFHLLPRSKPWIGPLGKFLTLGANIIYTAAFIRFITGRKLSYLVTKKGEHAKNQVPLKTFRYHIFIVLSIFFALIWSIYSHHEAIQLRLWAIFTAASLSAVTLSVYWTNVRQWFQSYTSFYRFMNLSLKSLFAFVCLIVAIALYTHKAKIVEAGLLRHKTVEQSIGATAVSPKIIPPISGAYLGISLYQHNDWEILNTVEQIVQKHFAIVGFYQAWGSKDNQFNSSWARHISDNGAIPMISWEPWVPVGGYDRRLSKINQRAYRLQKISNGIYDDYIKTYAQDIKKFGRPIMLRFAHEMNGNWYPWGTTYNSNSQYISAWRHIHDIFEAEEVPNVTWVWSPNEIYDGNNDIEKFYPGDAYVDWVGLSAFNWAGLYKNNSWKSPSELFTPTISILKKFPKPIMIAETASAEIPSQPKLKAEWIDDLARYIKYHPEIKALLWFNTNEANINWSITSSPDVQNAFQTSFTDDSFIQKISPIQ